MRRVLCYAIALMVTMVMSARAAVPQLINFQSLLADSFGTAVTDGNYSVEFTIYDAAAGGTSVWNETQIVTTDGGLFSVLFGSVNPVTDAVFNGTTRYLGIAVDGDPELSPRSALVSVPYAHRVSTVDGSAGGNITSKVSIGTGHTNTGDHSFVAGENNSTVGIHSSVGGGHDNTASGLESNISGGHDNTASAHDATIGGGYNNRASGFASTVAGGSTNNAFNDYATVPGGQNNSASGTYSFAAGRRAKANHSGAFVWGDSFNGDVLSSAVNQFTARTSGGARFYSNSGLTAGVAMAAGGGSWTSISDRDLKSNFDPVHAQSVLEKVCNMPMSTWNYNSQDESIRHMGPMAQDFHAAFGLGTDDKHIATIDADGVALAAIQGLNQKLVQRDARIEELRIQLEQLQSLVESALACGDHETGDQTFGVVEDASASTPR